MRLHMLMLEFKGLTGPISKHHIMYRQSGSDRPARRTQVFTNHILFKYLLNIFHLEKNLPLGKVHIVDPVHSLYKTEISLEKRFSYSLWNLFLPPYWKWELQIFSYPISFLAES